MIFVRADEEEIDEGISKSICIYVSKEEIIGIISINKDVLIEELLQEKVF